MHAPKDEKRNEIELEPEETQVLRAQIHQERREGSVLKIRVILSRRLPFRLQKLSI